MESKKRNLCFWDKFAIAIGILGQTALFTQAYKTYSIERAHDLSAFSYVICLASVIGWLLYGIALKNKPLIISNILGVVGILVVLAGIVWYG